jgi:HlyD family secretion protein
VQDNRVFRQAVLDRLASPEQLDKLMRVTDAKGWFALVGLGLLLVTAVVWGFLGNVPTKVAASGILIYSGGLADVVAMSRGQVTALEVEVGEYVKEGQAIAKVAQPELVEQIAAMEAKIAELRRNYEKAKATGERDVTLRMGASSGERRNLDMSIAANQARAKDLQEKLTTQEKLLEKGLITQEAIQLTKEQLRTIQVEAQSLEASKARVDSESFSVQRVNESVLMGETVQIADAERQLKLMQERLVQSDHVTSTHAGRVVEVRVAVGDVITPGVPLVSLERVGQKGTLEALLYVDSREGKSLREGMPVQIAPSVVRKERDGLLLGSVRSVESFPSTKQGMMRVLRNEQLVDAFLQETNGTPIAVRATLSTASDTPSGYQWSSGKGPDVVLTSGTRSQAHVTTRKRRPIALVIPQLDRDGR